MKPWNQTYSSRKSGSPWVCLPACIALVISRQLRAGKFLWACLMLLLLMGQLTGCSRSFWREHADDDTYDAMADKFSDPRWQVPRVDVLADPRSRFFDPYDPDKEPLPPPDPAAYSYMQQVDGMRGWKGWHKFGVTFSVENPQWLEPFELKPEQLQYGPGSASDTEMKKVEQELEDQPANPNDSTADNSTLPNQNVPGENLVPTIEDLTLADAIELSNINSREYQTAIEDLYLRALALTFDRFQFNVRFLGFGGRPTSRATYESVPGVRDRITFSNRFGMSQLLPTGAQWIVEFANDTIWLFHGGRSTTASVLSYRLTQPLLLGAGRKVVLEDLTQQEREVLYEVRSLARFRKEFFTDIVAGSPGFLGILNQSQVIDNQERNIYRLIEQLELQRIKSSQRPDEISEQLEQLPANLQIPENLVPFLRYDDNLKLLVWRGKTMTEEQEDQFLGLSKDQAYLNAANEIIQRLNTTTVTLPVAQLESQLARSQNSLQQSQRRQQDLLDQFKLQLGLPPDFQVSIDESMLKPFQLIDPRLDALEKDVKNFVKDWAQLDEDQPNPPLLKSVVDGLTQLRQRLITEGVEIIQQDIKNVDGMLKSEPQRGVSIRDFNRLSADISRDKRLFRNNVREKLAETASEIKQLQEIAAQKNIERATWKKVVRQIAELRERFLMSSQNLQVIQIGLRVELITLEPFQMSLQESIANGMENRLDLKNERARVMDARRRIEVTANELEAILDVAVEGDVRTPVGTRPFDFRGDLSSYRAGISLTAPLDQIRQRNVYRAALLDYQRARRGYMAAEDGVKLQIRQSWRQLQVLKENFEISRRAVRINALQFDSAVESSNAPGQAQGNNSGQQGLNLLNALSDVLEAQNDLIGIWIEYERSRLNIYRDMGIMDIDARGIWRDSYYVNLVEKSSNRVEFPKTFDPPDDKMEGPAIPPQPAPPAEPTNLTGEKSRVPQFKNLARTGTGQNSGRPIRSIASRFVELPFSADWLAARGLSPARWIPELISHKNKQTVVLSSH